MFQDFRLLPNKTVHQNVAYALQVLGSVAVADPLRRCRRRSSSWASRAWRSACPHQLSGGEQQRVAIARAFVNRPPILLADEPTGNLDPDTSLEIVQLLDRINRTGTTVVMATHDTATVNAMRKRVIRLDEGVLVGDVEAGDYTTGVDPAGRARDRRDPRPRRGPAGRLRRRGAGGRRRRPPQRRHGSEPAGDARRPVGPSRPSERDADAPRAKWRDLPPHKAAQTSDR